MLKSYNFAKLLKNNLGGTSSPLFVYIIFFFMDQAEEIRNLAVENLSPDKFVVAVLVSGKKIPKRVSVIIDGDQGVTIDDCANLSRILSKAFDERGFFGDDNYELEVSTPGLDHPLSMKRQYTKNIGRNMKIVSGGSTVEGKLAEVTGDKIVLIQETGAGKKKVTREIEFLFADIDKAFVLVSFK